MSHFKTLSRHEENSLSFDLDLNFLYDCKKISMSSTHLFPLERNKIKNLDLKRVQFLKENFGGYSQQLKTGYATS